MDVVPANPEEWSRDPFKLERGAHAKRARRPRAILIDERRGALALHADGDKLYGRGVTDCLGHVALITNFLKQLGKRGAASFSARIAAAHVNATPYSRDQARAKAFKCVCVFLKPRRGGPRRRVNCGCAVIVVFIANEENSSVEGVGMDALQSHGELEVLRKGPLYWIDSANMGPTLGTGGMLTWKLTVNGEKGHSGVPQAAINALELAMEAIRHAQERFFRVRCVPAAEERPATPLTALRRAGLFASRRGKQQPRLLSQLRARSLALKHGLLPRLFAEGERVPLCVVVVHEGETCRQAVRLRWR